MRLRSTRIVLFRRIFVFRIMKFFELTRYFVTMKHCATIALLCLLLDSCHYHREGIVAVLQQADSLIGKEPSRGLAFLDSLQEEVTEWPESRQMRYHLMRLTAMNKAYIPFTTDSKASMVADYYNQHGNANDRLRACYLLGCVYRDLGETPHAVECLLDAISVADTLASDCDFNTLGCVYSQLGWLYHQQLLLSLEKNAHLQASHFNLLAKDTAFALYEKRAVAGVYIQQNKLDSARSVILDVIQAYDSYHMHQEALQTSTLLMYILCQQNGALDSLKNLIDHYDAESNYFDVAHELPPSQRLFYNYKGTYYEREEMYDSAEYYFRKMQSADMPYTSKNTMYKGLLRVFENRQQPDSIAKYARMYCSVNDSSIATKDQELTAQMAASFRYTTIQREARVNEEKVHRQKMMLIIISFSVLVFLFGGAFLVNKYRIAQNERRRKQEEVFKKRHAEQERIHLELMRKQQLKSLQKEKELISIHHKEKIEQQTLYEKEKYELREKHEIELKELQVHHSMQNAEMEERHKKELQEFRERQKQDKEKLLIAQTNLQSVENEKQALAMQNDSLRKEMDLLNTSGSVSAKTIENAREFSQSKVFERVVYISKHPRERVSEKEWEELSRVFSSFYPLLFHDLSAVRSKKKTLRMRICILTVMGMGNGEQSALLDESRQTIANNTAALNFSLFGEKTAVSFSQNISKQYNICIWD